MDIKRLIREQLRDAMTRGDERAAGRNIAVAANVSTSGSTTQVYSDDEVTIVTRDGVSEVIRHRPHAAGSTDDAANDEK